MVVRESWRMVGDRIHALRKESGLTQRQLGLGCGMSPNAISLVERGRVAPTIESLCKIAHALGVSASSLFQEVCPGEVILSRAAEGRLPVEVKEGLWFQGGKRGQPSSPDACGLPQSVRQTVICLCGELVYEMNQRSMELSPGDSLTFLGDTCQHWRNTGRETAIAVIILPPGFEPVK